jgi:hypothetical protein
VGNFELKTRKRRFLSARAGVVDGELRDPRVCEGVFDAKSIRCTGASNATCLTEGEAKAMNMIWGGSRNTKGELMW